MDDFHFQSLHQDIRPLIFFHVDSPIWGDQRVIAVKYYQGQADQVLTNIQTMWKKFVQKAPLDYSILDEELNQHYQSERQLGKLVNLLTYFSIFIALLGLIGLVAYTTEQRKKEIGIRKVLGASIGSLFVMINKQYIYLLFAGLLISIPFTWYVISRWLQDFAYHISISWYIFALSAIVMLILALVSVGYLVLKAAHAHPIEAIRE